MPPPRGRPVDATACVDASFGQNKKTRRSHSGHLIFVNRAPIIWFSKKQTTIETSAFSAEFIALKSCVEAITCLRFKLRMFGMPIRENAATHVLCDNESVVKNAALLESTLNKKHNSNACHFVRWQVAAGTVSLAWIESHNNLADAFTKHLSAQTR